MQIEIPRKVSNVTNETIEHGPECELHFSTKSEWSFWLIHNECTESNYQFNQLSCSIKKV